MLIATRQIFPVKTGYKQTHARVDHAVEVAAATGLSVQPRPVAVAGGTYALFISLPAKRDFLSISGYGCTGSLRLAVICRTFSPA